MRRVRPKNLLLNPSFDGGADRPSHWEWVVISGRPVWTLDYDVKYTGRRSIKVIQDVGNVRGEFRQRVRCKPDTRYRLQARIRTALEGAGEQCGANLCLAAFSKRRLLHELFFRPMLLGREDWLLWTADYRTPAKADSLLVTFDMRNADGVAWFDAFELFEAPEPLTHSVSPAAPELPRLGFAPRRARIHVFPADPREPLVTDVPAPLVGASNVTAGHSLSALPSARADAVVIRDCQPDAAPPFETLEQLASRRLYVLSPRALVSSLRGRGVVMREVADRLISPCARIESSGFLTRGLCAGDIMDWSFALDASGVRCQTQIRSAGERLSALGFHTIASSVCGSSRDSGHPVIIYRPFPRGGILVMDLSALGRRPLLGNDGNLPCLILSNALGRPQTLFGSYVAPRFDYDSFCDDLTALAGRYPNLTLTREGSSGLGKPIYSLSLGPASAATFYVDCAIHPDEWAPSYGVLMYLARLADEYDRGMPWARAMLANIRIKCIPVIAPDGWDRNSRSPRGVNLNRNFPPFWKECPDKEKGRAPLSEPETRIVDRILRSDRVVTAVNFHETSANTNWVGFAAMKGRYLKYSTSVPSIFAQVIDGRHFWRQPSVWTQTPDQRNYHYHYTDSFPYLRDYSVSKSPFEILHAHNLGIEGILVEQYGNSDMTFTASPQRTDMTGFILEMLLGLRIGLVCRNARSEPVEVTIPVHVRDARRMQAFVYSPDGYTIAKRPLVRTSAAVFAKATLPRSSVLLVKRT